MNQVRAESAMFSQSGDEDLMTVSNTEDKSRRTRTDEWDEVLEAQSDSVTVRRPDSVL